MNVIEISGIRYIKASDAAKRVGYTTDYVGQLVRAGKIQGQQVGRAWYVSEEDILGHKKGNGRSNKQKTREQLHKAVEATATHAIYNTMYTPPAYVPEYRKRLLDTSVQYDRDESPLTLSLKSPSAHRAEPELERIAVVAEADEDEVHTARLGKDLVVEERTEPSTLGAERAPLPPMHGAISIQAEQEAEATEEAKEDKETDVRGARESRTDFERRLHNRTASEISADVGAKRQRVHSYVAPELTFIPAQVPGPRRQLALTSRASTVLVSALLLLAFTLSCSSVFLEKTLVYERGQGVNIRPTFTERYQIAEMATVREALSR